MNRPTHPDAVHLDDGQLTLLYFQEASAGDRQHLAACLDCRNRYQRLSDFLDAFHALPVPVKDAAWEQRLWTGIAPRVTAILAPKSRFSFQPWLLGPLLAGLLIAAFFAGRYTKSAPPPDAFSQKARDRVFLITLGDHLDRSQIVLAELVNAPEGKPFNMSAEQKVAGTLVGENRLLRQTVALHGRQPGFSANTAVLDQLERVLIDIAHSPAEVSPEELDQLRQRIAAQGLLFKVRVISSNAREKGMKL